MTNCPATKNTEVLVDITKLTPEKEVDIARSRMYNLLSLAFSFPKESLQSIQSDLWELAATLYPDMKIDKNIVDFGSKEIEEEYINVMDGHEQKLYCKPYEGLWETADSAKRQWEVKKFYQTFGLGLSTQINEMPDHIMHELEFMHFLTFKMADDEIKETDANQAKDYLLAQKDFLERHLTTWVGKFCELLQKKTDVPFYNQLGKVTAQFIEDDLEWVKEELEVFNKSA